jgi:hypothetical protein
LAARPTKLPSDVVDISAIENRMVDHLLKKKSTIMSPNFSLEPTAAALLDYYAGRKLAGSRLRPGIFSGGCDSAH